LSRAGITKQDEGLVVANKQWDRSMSSDANADAQAEADMQFLISDVSDNELERASATDPAQAVNTAFCTQWWICPF
jgi:hypothetical protein